jgi:hypothetical protein
MSFAECATRLFIAVPVRKNAPESSASEASNIRARLMEHLKETDTTLANRRPTGFTFEECPPWQSPPGKMRSFASSSRFAIVVPATRLNEIYDPRGVRK